MLDILASSTTGRMWNETLESPWFDYVDEQGVVHQVWYDDPQSLTTKYLLAKQMNLRGLGRFSVELSVLIRTFSNVECR